MENLERKKYSGERKEKKKEKRKKERKTHKHDTSAYRGVFTRLLKGVFFL